jgi:hypothetical protein
MTEEEWRAKYYYLKEELVRLQEQHASDKIALNLQAKEYERRLEALNHEHTRLDAAQATYVSYSALFGVISIIIAILTLIFAFNRVMP